MSRDNLWTLDELTAQVALALSVDYEGADNGRVRDVPDRRTIRYYTTLGLIDRPTAMRGRTAFYSRRHLLQLVAIKRLQVRGATLVEIQEKLLGLNEAGLRRLAKLPSEDRIDAGAAPAPAEPTRAAFWKTAAAPVLAASSSEPDATSPVYRDAAALTLQGVPLTDDVTLLFAAGRSLEDDDLEAIRASAAPLLQLLHTRRLLRPRTTRS